MKEHYITQINKNVELKEFYKGLTAKVDKIYHALTLISKYTAHKQTEERFISLGVDFLEMSYMLYPEHKEEHADIFDELESIVREIQALTQGLVIRGVFHVDSKKLFDKELQHYIQTVDTYILQIRDLEPKSASIPSPLFEDTFFGDSLHDPLFLKKNFESAVLSDSNLSENTPLSFIKKTLENAKGHDIVESTSKGHTLEKKKTDVVDRLNRKTAIINFIKDNKEVGIKDIVLHMSNCSEKTIQRELNDLIDESLIKKIGDRRWSKYSLY